MYLSTTPSLNWMAEPIFTVPITNSLLPGAGYWHSNTVTLHGVQNGDYFFVLKANSDSDLFEPDLDDNTLAMPVRFDSSLPSALTITDGQFLAGGSFQLAIYGNIGSEYILQASTNLLNWVAISNFTIVAVPTYIADPQAGAFQRRFYRVATVPAPTLPPALTITCTATNAVVISWPLPADGWVSSAPHRSSATRLRGPRSRRHFRATPPNPGLRLRLLKAPSFTVSPDRDSLAFLSQASTVALRD